MFKRIPLIFIASLSCKSAIDKPTQQPRDRASTTEELQLSLPRGLHCTENKNKNKNIELPFPIFFQKPHLYSQEEKNLFLDTLKNSYSQLPSKILDAFAKINGKILLVEDSTKTCPVSELYQDSYSKGLGGCWMLNEAQEIVITLSLLDSNGAPSLTALSYNSLISLGQIFEKILIHPMSFDQGELFPNSIEGGQEGFEPYRFAILEELYQSIDSSEEIPYNFELASFMISHSFFVYFCRAETRQILAENYPEAYKTIKELTGNYEFRSPLQNKENIGLGLDLKTIVRKVENTGQTIQKKIPTKTKRVDKLVQKWRSQPLQNAYNLREVQGIQTAKFGDIPSEERHLYTQNYTGAKYYTGKPRIVRSSSNFNHRKEDFGNPVTILVPGTYAGDSLTRNPGYTAWADLEGEVAQTINDKMSEGKGEVVGLQWSGKLDGVERVAAGRELAETIKILRSQGKEVNVIAHSHGANVVTAALRELDLQAGRGEIPPGFGLEKVNNFVSIGRPVMRSNDYKFTLSQISGRYLFVKGEDDLVPGITLNNVNEFRRIKNEETGTYTKVTVRTDISQRTNSFKKKSVEGDSSGHSDLVTEPIMSRILDLLFPDKRNF